MHQSCFPISPILTLEAPSPACACVMWSPARLHWELTVLCALSVLRTCAVSLHFFSFQLLFALALTLLVPAHTSRAYLARAFFCKHL